VEAHKVSKHYFEPGEISQKGLIQVKSGLAANTMIIVSNSTGLSAGQTVRVKHA